MKAWQPHYPTLEHKLLKAGLRPFTPKGGVLICSAFMPAMLIGAAGEWLLNGTSPNLFAYAMAFLFMDAWLILMQFGFDWT